MIAAMNQLLEDHYKEIKKASLMGNEDGLRYLLDNRISLYDASCRISSAKNDIECLQFLHEVGCPWNEQTCYHAAKHGQLDCLKYAHEHGCNWNEWTTYYACINQHQECLTYAMENGCKMNFKQCNRNVFRLELIEQGYKNVDKNELSARNKITYEIVQAATEQLEKEDEKQERQDEETRREKQEKERIDFNEQQNNDRMKRMHESWHAIHWGSFHTLYY